ncbi:MAG: 30S ribosome-binding factor RbfA [Mucinivorans sp.]
MKEQQSESVRQQKVGALVQKEMADIFIKQGAPFLSGAMVSITKVRVTPDLAVSKIYLSVFPFDKSQGVLQAVKKGASTLRYELSRRIGQQVRIIPEVIFYIDDSIEYVERIEQLLK